MKEYISILREANLIDKDIEEKLYKIVDTLKIKWNIVLSEEKGGTMLSHLGRALVRIKNGEEILGLNDDILEEIKQSENYKKVLDIYRDIEEILKVTMSKEEASYMYANILFLLEG